MAEGLVLSEASILGLRGLTSPDVISVCMHPAVTSDRDARQLGLGPILKTTLGPLPPTSAGLRQVPG